MKFQAVLKEKMTREKYLRQLAASQYPNLFIIPSLKERETKDLDWKAALERKSRILWADRLVSAKDRRNGIQI